MRITLSAIAKETGFSTNTVSRAIRGDTKISLSTRTLIQEVADNMGYLPNFIANSMRSKKTYTIGVISADSSNPFFAEVLCGIEETARQLGYHIILMNTHEDPEHECDALNILQARQVDGVIAMPLYQNTKAHNIYKKFPVPFIFAGRRVAGFENHSILHYDEESIKKVVLHLLEGGHKNIVYIGGPEKISNAIDRRVGFEKAFSEKGLSKNDSLMFQTQGHIDEGYAVINRLIKQQVPFSACVCFNDLLCIGVLKSLHENHLFVPEQVEIVGCDNLFLSQYLQPQLTTIEVPKYLLGKKAVLELIEHVENKDMEYKAIHLETRTVFRETTKNKEINS